MTSLSTPTAALALLGAWLCTSCSSSGTDVGMDSGMEPDASQPDPKCNGHEELCDRRFDQVAYPLFIDRARQCEAEGDDLPNFVAVDFYDIGDLFDVVDALNGF